MARELLEKFRQNGIMVHLRDFSLDTGIPTVAALAYDPSTFPADSEIVFAAGTTTDPTKSLIRALTEVAQLAGDFHRRTSYRPTLPKYETLEEAAYLMAPGPHGTAGQPPQPLPAQPQRRDSPVPGGPVPPGPGSPGGQHHPPGVKSRRFTC